jgi:hypothetical protein
MKRQLQKFMPVWLIAAGIFTMLGCTATSETSTDITAAPFELTSSTSGRTPYPLGLHVQAERFATHNFENLKQDMAQGRGSISTRWAFSSGYLDRVFPSSPPPCRRPR